MGVTLKFPLGAPHTAILPLIATELQTLSPLRASLGWTLDWDENDTKRVSVTVSK